jgi:Rhodopirellula transposase DDE domain
MKQVHQDAEAARDTVRVSVDSKAAVKVGPFSRGGQSRTGNQGADHDFQPQGHLTPLGIFMPERDELDLYFTASKVTSDFMVDALEQWWRSNRERLQQCGEIKRLIVELDNGPENNSHRTQFLYRLAKFAREYHLLVQLCYYPPYHSKYNPIERCWGILEGYWRGEILDSEEAILGYAREMTYNGVHPNVHRVAQEYSTGVKRTKAQMKEVEAQIDRLPGLEKWFVDVYPESLDQIIH